ncbi:hypothetical protein Q7P37_000726 [Cladosporium fusiforme]
MDVTTRYPNALESELREAYVGKSLQEADTPVAIIDVAAARRNCQSMLDACDTLGVKFRAHVKTHKTVELTKLQVGEGNRPVNLAVSTISELEFLLPFLSTCVEQGRAVNVLYGLPVSPSVVPRLLKAQSLLGEGSISVLIDNADAVTLLSEAFKAAPHKISVYVKLDTGGNRAGVQPASLQLDEILQAFKTHSADHGWSFELHGFYSHLGASYASSSTGEALGFLLQEIERCAIASSAAKKVFPESSFTIAVGATPTAMAAQNLLDSMNLDATAKQAKESLDLIKESFNIEIHAGAYCTLDMQQLASRSRPENTNLGYDDVALTVLAEVASLYPHRSPPEALIASGCLALGRESCKSYPGMGVITPWKASLSGGAIQNGIKEKDAVSHFDPLGSPEGWIVDRIAQEHGILSWQGPQENIRSLALGEKVRIWPNHCCITAACFGYFLVVDSSAEGAEKDRIVDVWVRCRGW